MFNLPQAEGPCFHCAVNQALAASQACHPRIHMVPAAAVPLPQPWALFELPKIIPEGLRETFLLRSNSVNATSSPVLQRMEPNAQEQINLTMGQVNTSGGHYGHQYLEHFGNLSLDVGQEWHEQGMNPQSTAFNHELPSNCHGGAMLQESGLETNVNEDFYSIKEEDKSILLCVPNQSPDSYQIHSRKRVSENEDSLIESVLSTTEDRSTPPMTSVCTRDAMVGTEQTMTWSALSQTEPQQTTDKHLNTELYMLDLDYFTKDFIAIKTERDELLEKVKMARIPSPVARIVNDLKKLETGYNKMREKILSGISLQELKPLFIDEEETDLSAVAMPNSDVPKDSVSSPQQHDYTSDKLVPTSDNNNKSQESEMTDCTKSDNKTKRAVTFVPKERGSTNGKPLATDKPEAVSPGLCVTGLPTNATETDVMMCFQKYNVSEVHTSNLKELSVAIVIVGNQESAEAAVKELNGLKIKGQTLQVQHIIPSRPEDQDQCSTCISDTESANNPSTINQNQLSSFSHKKKVVCASPTAQGTFEPQHYGTMDSLDTLMSELTQRHPNASRTTIVDALLELRAKYRGVLSSFPLNIIRDMVSDILTRPAKPAE